MFVILNFIKSCFEEGKSLMFGKCKIFDTSTSLLLYPPYPKDGGMLWFYVEAARNGVNAITQKPWDGLLSNLVYTLVVIVSWPD